MTTTAPPLPDIVPVTTLPDPQATKDYLLAVGTKAPSLHPRVNSTGRDRWAGWNSTVAAGVDATGAPIDVEAWHFASGRVDFAHHVLGGKGLLSKDRFGCYFTFPIQLFPAQSVIRCPEWTP